MSDQEIVERAVKKAEQVLRDYIQPRRQRDCGQTMNRLLEILDNDEVVSALRRIDQSIQINATIDGATVVEMVNGREAALQRAHELIEEGVQELKVILPDGTFMIEDDETRPDERN